MNKSFLTILSAPIEDRRGLFLATANRLGIPVQNIEKDFWVCWTLDLLFNTRDEKSPRLLFKGGTSLSKAYGLIYRFSEDIDITVFREDLNQMLSLEELEQLSGKQQRKYLDEIKEACKNFIQNNLKKHIEHQIELLFPETSSKKPIVALDLSDPSQQTLLIHYPSVTNNTDDYIIPTIKIECGAKSALDPHQLATIKPYISEELPHTNFDINNVITINAERTFWDKIIILHGIRRWYDLKGVLRQNGHRFSRHYYDVYQLMHSSLIPHTKSNHALALDCSRHAQMFFNSVALDLKNAHPGSFSLIPSDEMQPILKRDYKAMEGMIFGEIPDFSEIINKITYLEHEINILNAVN